MNRFEKAMKVFLEKYQIIRFYAPMLIITMAYEFYQKLILPPYAWNFIEALAPGILPVSVK